MFDPQFISILIKYNKFANYVHLHRANYHLMEAKIRNNYRKIKTDVCGIDSIFDECYEFIYHNQDFISYYDNWFDDY